MKNLCEELNCYPHFVVGNLGKFLKKKSTIFSTHEKTNQYFIQGHSFGGKVALEFARRATITPSKVICLDSYPSVISEEKHKNQTNSSFGNISAPEMLEILQKIELPILTKTELKKKLQDLGFSNEVAIWMTTNLRKQNEGHVWTFNLPQVTEVTNFLIFLLMAAPLTSSSQPKIVVRVIQEQMCVGCHIKPPI